MGEAFEPSNFYEVKKENEQLKLKLSALEATGFQMISQQLTATLQKNGGLMGLIVDEKNPLQKLVKDNEEIRRNLEELLQRGIQSAGTATVGRTVNFGNFWPPQPTPDFDGSIQKGISYRYGGSPLNVADKEGNPLVVHNPYEVALLQL